MVAPSNDDRVLLALSISRDLPEQLRPPNGRGFRAVAVSDAGETAILTVAAINELQAIELTENILPGWQVIDLVEMD